MKVSRGMITLLLALAFLWSSAFGHVHTVADHAAPAIHVEASADHGAETGNHQHHRTGSDHHGNGKDSMPTGHIGAEHADMPNCCSMGACGTSDVMVRLKCPIKVDMALYAPAVRDRPSVIARPEAPPPRMNG